MHDRMIVTSRDCEEWRVAGLRAWTWVVDGLRRGRPPTLTPINSIGSETASIYDHFRKRPDRGTFSHKHSARQRN